MNNRVWHKLLWNLYLSKLRWGGNKFESNLFVYLPDRLVIFLGLYDGCYLFLKNKIMSKWKCVRIFVRLNEIMLKMFGLCLKERFFYTKKIRLVNPNPRSKILSYETRWLYLYNYLLLSYSFHRERDKIKYW